MPSATWCGPHLLMARNAERAHHRGADRRGWTSSCAITSKRRPVRLHPEEIRQGILQPAGPRGSSLHRARDAPRRRGGQDLHATGPRHLQHPQASRGGCSSCDCPGRQNRSHAPDSWPGRSGQEHAMRSRRARSTALVLAGLRRRRPRDVDHLAGQHRVEDRLLDTLSRYLDGAAADPGPVGRERYLLATAAVVPLVGLDGAGSRRAYIFLDRPSSSTWPARCCAGRRPRLRR